MNFKKITIREQISSRGGGIEIDLTSLGFSGVRMTAYQNYLGGGMLGRVMSDCTISDYATNERLSSIAEKLREYFHGLTNSDCEWSSTSYEENQRMSGSAY